MIKVFFLTFLLMISSSYAYALDLSYVGYVKLKTNTKFAELNIDGAYSCRHHEYKFYGSDVSFLYKKTKNQHLCLLKDNQIKIHHFFSDLDIYRLQSLLNLSSIFKQIEDSEYQGKGRNPICEFSGGKLVQGSCSCKSEIMNLGGSQDQPSCVLKKKIIKASANTCSEDSKKMLSILESSLIDSTLSRKEIEKCGDITFYIQYVENPAFKEIVFALNYQREINDFIERRIGKEYQIETEYLAFDGREDWDLFYDFEEEFLSKENDTFNDYRMYMRNGFNLKMNYER